MVKKIDLFKHQERKNRADVSDFLKQLAEKIAVGQVILRQPQDDLVLDLPHHITMKMKVNKKNKRVKGTRHKMSIKLEWCEDDNEGPLTLG